MNDEAELRGSLMKYEYMGTVFGWSEVVLAVTSWSAEAEITQLTLVLSVVKTSKGLFLGYILREPWHRNGVQAYSLSRVQSAGQEEIPINITVTSVKGTVDLGFGFTARFTIITQLATVVPKGITCALSISLPVNLLESGYSKIIIGDEPLSPDWGSDVFYDYRECSILHDITYTTHDEARTGGAAQLANQMGILIDGLKLFTCEYGKRKNKWQLEILKK